MSQHSRLYNNTRWRKLRARQLSHYPLCAYCLRKGLAVEATVCDHCQPHKGDLIKFWSGPFQSLCKPCHDGLSSHDGFTASPAGIRFRELFEFLVSRGRRKR